MTPDPIDAVMADINKAQGKNKPPIIFKGADILDTRYQRASTGSLSFDLAHGGGWPLNGVNEIIGNESSGKTSLTLKTIATQQALDPTHHTVWAAAEDFDFSWAATLGVDASRMTFIESNIMEEVYEAALQVMRRRATDALVIDSLPALVPSDEDEKTMAELTVGRGALLTNKFMRKSYGAASRSKTEYDRPILVLIINQWRDVITQFGDPRTTPGGKGKNFTYLTRTEVTRDEWLKDKDEMVGQVIKVRTIKNKTFKPRRVGQTDFYFDDANGHFAGDYDIIKEVYNIALELGIIERKGAWYHFNGDKWNGKDAVWEAMKDDQAMIDALDTQVRAAVLGLAAPSASASAPRKRTVLRS